MNFWINTNVSQVRIKSEFFEDYAHDDFQRFTISKSQQSTIPSSLRRSTLLLEPFTTLVTSAACPQVFCRIRIPKLLSPPLPELCIIHRKVFRRKELLR